MAIAPRGFEPHFWWGGREMGRWGEEFYSKDIIKKY